MWRVSSVVQPMSCYDLLTYKAIGSNYLSFVVTSMLVSTSPLDEAGTATHFPLSETSGRKGPANVVSSADHPITSGSPVWRVSSVVQPMSCYDLLTYKAIGSNYLSFVVTSMLVSTSPLDEAGTATHGFFGRDKS